MIQALRFPAERGRKLHWQGRCIRIRRLLSWTEPTAALDPQAEAEIYSRFSEIVGDKTAVYISHRLSSCRFCDNIAVFDNGNIVQRGSHEELLGDQNGKYSELWNAQAQYYTEDQKQR